MKPLKNLYKPIDPFHIMIIKNFIWGLLGISLGIIINNLVTTICKIFKIKILIIQIIIQLILCAFILTLIQYLFNYFGWTWQNTTFGLFFISFFFGIQFDIFRNIEYDFESRYNK
jgi:hypothetical protein